MYPVAYITLPAGSTALSNFVFMVGKHKVHSSTMYVKRITKISSTHGTAFNMPTGSSRAPRTIPERFPFLSGLPTKKKQKKGERWLAYVALKTVS